MTGHQFTGLEDLDRLLRTILTNPMIGGFLAFFLDNTIPGIYQLSHDKIRKWLLWQYYSKYQTLNPIKWQWHNSNIKYRFETSQSVIDIYFWMIALQISWS